MSKSQTIPAPPDVAPVVEQPSVEQARATVGQYRDAELALIERRAAIERELETARQDAADAMLAAIIDGRDAPASARVAALRDELAAIASAADQARRRRVEAIGAAWRAEAAALREQAATLRQEIEARQARTDELLAALEAHEGVRYVPYRPDGRGAVGSPLVIVVPATDGKRRELADLERRAEELEARRVPDRGHVTAETRDALIAALRGWEAFALAPALEDALAWFDTAAASWTRRTPQGEPAPFTAELVWTDGRVDPARSRLTG